MSQTESYEPGTLDVDAVRSRIFAGLASVSVFAEAAERTERTVATWIAEGLPVVYFGRTPLVRVDAASDWLLSRREAHPNIPRRGLLSQADRSAKGPAPRGLPTAA